MFHLLSILGAVVVGIVCWALYALLIKSSVMYVVRGELGQSVAALLWIAFWGWPGYRSVRRLTTQ